MHEHQDQGPANTAGNLVVEENFLCFITRGLDLWEATALLCTFNAPLAWQPSLVMSHFALHLNEQYQSRLRLRIEKKGCSRLL